MLASISVPLAIELMCKMFRKRLHIGPPPPKGGRGMHINPPLFFGSWGEYKKKLTFRFPILIRSTGASIWTFPSKESFRPTRWNLFHHSPCVINMDDFGSMGTLWVSDAGAQKMASKNSLALSVCRRKERHVDLCRSVQYAYRFKNLLSVSS